MATCEKYWVAANSSPISLWTVAKEMGHKSVARIEDTYGHASHYRPRGEVVEYRIDQG